MNRIMEVIAVLTLIWSKSICIFPAQLALMLNTYDFLSEEVDANVINNVDQAAHFASR